MTLVILIGGGALIAFVIGAFVHERDKAAEQPVTGRCRRCGRPTAWMHGDLVHTSEEGYYVAVQHRPLPVDVHGPHPARGYPLRLAARETHGFLPERHR